MPRLVRVHPARPLDSMNLHELYIYLWKDWKVAIVYTHRIHGAAIYGNMDPINIPQSC